MKIKIKLSILALLTLSIVSCKDDNSNSINPVSDAEKIEKLVASIDPFIISIGSKLGREDAYLISFEIVKNKTTGEIALMNFEKENTFPLVSASEIARRANGGDKGYQVDCSKGGKTTSKDCTGKFSCGS